MPTMSMQAFAAAQFAGQQLNVETENRKQDVEMKKEQIAESKQNMAFKQQQQQMMKSQQEQMSKMIADYDQEQKDKKIETGELPDTEKEDQLSKQAALHRKMASLYTNDPKTMESWTKIADGEDAQRSTLETKNLAIKEKKIKDAGSFAGSQLDALDHGVPIDQVMKATYAWKLKNDSLAGAEALSKDPAKFKSDLRQVSRNALSEAERTSQDLRISEDKTREEARKIAAIQHQDNFISNQHLKAMSIGLAVSAAADRKEARASRLAQAEIDKADKKAEKRSATAFKETEALNKSLQTQAKPFLEDKQRIEDVEGLLMVNSSAADQQVHQALTAVLGNFKGRATNLFYKDNKNYGSVANKLTGFVSHAFTGRYQDNDRAAIRDMLSEMKKHVVEPALVNLENKQKEHAKGYEGLDSNQIEIQGDFDRSAKPKAVTYSEGTVATNPTTGAKMVLKNGKWVPQ